ncbi:MULTISPECIES: flavin reductase family protein [unclassified Massilia]|uniref:flavin reductase family protein n=1 Tax=unclassified Massilia TaxID=2609279 RepID=UPI0017871599|nr:MULTISPECIES: flavin reductase family protein [unclassified Massilia]MBD8532096.1 flavin reductase family protein [Massilia sp. CFBP 13647]MBD8675542.1 flavin reductase family protein [Massilia sp. CFBP 13721]
MGRQVNKRDFPVEQVRRYLESGPLLLLSSAHEGERDIMTLGWHTVMEFTPSLVGCVIASGNRSFELVRRSRECVLNLPTTALIDEVVAIGTSSGRDGDKFERLGLSPEQQQGIAAPGIAECHAQFACRLHDDRLVDQYNFFIWEVIAARVAPTPRHPRTLHYAGGGTFLVPDKIMRRRTPAILALDP